MKRTAATRRTATRTSDRAFCFFRSSSQSSVSFGFRQAFLDLIKKGSKLVWRELPGFECRSCSGRRTVENVRHPTGSRDA
jgi:hypothetical protein